MKEDGAEKWRRPSSQNLKRREDLNISPSSASIAQVKYRDVHGPPNLTRNKRVSIPYHQSALYSSNWKKMDGHQTQASSKSMHNSLLCRQSSSSSNKVWRPSSSRSQEAISPQLVACQQMPISSHSTIDADREGGPGSEPVEYPSDVCRNAESSKSIEPIHSSSNNNVRRSSPSCSQETIYPQLVVHQKMQISIDADRQGGPGSEPVECSSVVCRNAESSKSMEPISSSSSSEFLRSSANLCQGITSLRLEEHEQRHSSSPRTVDDDRKKSPGRETEKDLFDICGNVNSTLVKLKKPLLILNRERRKEVEHTKNALGPKYLRSGMLLLKNFISHFDQVKIVNKCRDLGKGFGGFYSPGYRDGAKLHLRMMCLGKDWDPESRSYGDSRQFDGAVPPEIPVEFKNLLDGALHDVRNFLKRSAKSVEEIPNMSPDLCIVNFYSNTGKLGLHQDRDESEKSIDKGLPVVSFSIGDSAEFLYSDKRDGETEKVVLESGDVLIFGGKSRRIFHGVASIKPKTAPSLLLEETNLRPGRLNLTFRQY